MTAIEYQGQIYLCDGWSAQLSEPVEVRAFWATGLSAQDWPQLLNQPARRICSGIYEVAGTMLPMSPRQASHHIESRPLPKPRGKTMYYNGRWHRN